MHTNRVRNILTNCQISSVESKGCEVMLWGVISFRRKIMGFVNLWVGGKRSEKFQQLPNKYSDRVSGVENDLPLKTDFVFS